MTLANLISRTDLNGQTCLTICFFVDSGRWAVTISSTGECVRVKPENLFATTDPTCLGDGAHCIGNRGRVFVFWVLMRSLEFIVFDLLSLI